MLCQSVGLAGITKENIVTDSRTLTAPNTGFELFSDKTIVAMRVNGELRDLAHQAQAGDVVEGVEISSPDGLNILRHSTAHVLAQAVQRINPEAQLGIGPPVTDGFYYDFKVDNAFTPEDLSAIEKEMNRIVQEGQRFMRRVVSDDEARAELANEPFKLELIGLKGDNTGDDNESVEVGGSELTIYDNVDPKTGETSLKRVIRVIPDDETFTDEDGTDVTMEVTGGRIMGIHSFLDVERLFPLFAAFCTAGG